MEEEVVWMPFQTMKQFVADVFMGVGVPPEDAEICADVLIAADKKGVDSHGINRLKSIYYDRIKSGIVNPVTNFEIVRDNMATAVIDGHDGMGHVIGKKSMDLCIEKARKFGIGMVTVRNSSHYGIAGYYPMMAVVNDMIGITGTNARPSIAPTNGCENMLGTNPLSYAIPSDEDFPFYLDGASSNTQRGTIELYERLGKSCPPEWVISEDGNEMTDPKEILEALVEGTAALTPIGSGPGNTGGYKGYGYATVVEILSSALQTGSFLKMLTGFQNGKAVPYHLGHFFIAIDVASFTDVSDFKNQTGEILRALRNSKRVPGGDRIFTPGEKEHLKWLSNKDKGIALNRELREDVKTMQKEVGLNKYNFPF